MTLIACLHPRQGRTLIADTLVTSPAAPENDVVFPSRVYIPPDKLRTMPWQSAGFMRKIIEISPSLVALWSGNLEEARRFAARAIDWFGTNESNEEAVKSFLNTYYSERVVDLHAIIVPADQNWLCWAGTAQHSSSPFAGEYVVAGTGSSLFREMTDRMPISEITGPSPDLDGLRIASGFFDQEIMTKAPLKSAFGGPFEVFYPNAGKFERVDDVVHGVVRVKVDPKGINVEFRHPHLTRQWYEDDELWVASVSTKEATQQGMEFKAFSIPSVTRQSSCKFKRTLDSLWGRPKYICINHVFQFGGVLVPTVLAMRESVIDQMLSFSHSGDTLTLEFTAAYKERLRQRILEVQAKLVAELGPLPAILPVPHGATIIEE